MKLQKRAQEAWGTGIAQEVTALIDGSKDPMEYDRVKQWVGQCFNMPSDNELIMAALDEVIDGYGTEAIFSADGLDVRFSYVNMGDTYNTTIVYNHRGYSYHVACYGDFV